MSGIEKKKEENLMNNVWDDSELLKMYDESVKFSGTVKASNTENVETQWKVGDTCMAPFDDLWYSAKIISIQEDEKTARVHFVDYEDDEDDATVKLVDLYKEEEVKFEEGDEDQNNDEDVDMNTSIDPSKSDTHNFHISMPKLVPPPPELFQTFTNEKEITNNMMVSWYMSGYHTGYFQAMRDFQSNAKSPKH